MKLTELSPRWASSNGVRDHVNFLCPICRQHMIAVPFAGPPPLWTISGDNFENLTLAPSILHRTHYADGMNQPPRFCESHFWIRSGEIIIC